MKSCYYVGTYTQDILFGTGEILEGKGKGIYLLELDHNTGFLEHKTLFSAETLSIANPSYLCLSPDKNTLYCVNELKEFNDINGGAVTSIALAKSMEDIPVVSNIHTVPTYGADPCYVSVSGTSPYLLIANYSGGSICIYALDSEGMVKTHLQLISFTEHSINPNRQESSHLHSVVCSNDNSLMVAANLGSDQLLCYSPDFKMVQRINTPHGSGPRHSAFHPYYNYLYTSLELSSQIIVNTLESDGAWHTVQLIDSYYKSKGNEKTGNLCADLHISPDGNYLYCSNRGTNYISVFKISQLEGTLSHIQDIDCHGLIPRSFCLDISGEFLLAANQDSDNISVFRIDRDTGRLTFTSSCSIPTPVCIISA